MKNWREKLHFSFLTLILLSFSFGQIGRVSLWDQKANFYIFEPVLILALVFLMVEYRFKPIRQAYVANKYLYLFFGYMFLNFCVFIFNFSPIDNVIALAYAMRLLSYTAYSLYFLHFLQSKPYLRTLLTRILLIFTIINSITAWFQYLFYPNLRNLAYLGWDPHLYRMVSVYLEPPVAGAVFGILLSCTVFFLLPNHSKLRIGMIFLLGIQIMLTFARGLYLAFLITALIFLLKKYKVKAVLLFITFIAVALILIPKPFGEGVNLLRTSTIQSRIEDYQKGISLLREHYVLGVGYNRIREFKEPQVTSYSGNEFYSHAGASFHASLLVVAVSLGLVGLVLYLLWMWEMAKLNEFSFYLVIFLNIASLFDNLLLHAFVYFLFIFFIKLSSYLYYNSR